MTVPLVMDDYSGSVRSSMPRSRSQKTTSSGSGDEEWAPHPYYSSPLETSSGNVRECRRCKVDGCGVDLSTYKTFYRRAHCCQLHARELMVYVENVPKRLCQQCSAFHPLADFDGTKKSCRTKLQAHKIRQREHSNRRMAEAAAAMQRQTPAPSATAPSLPLPAAGEYGQPADGSGGVMRCCSVAVQEGQQLPAGHAQPYQAVSWAPQQLAPWQQPQLVADLQQWAAMQEHAVYMQQECMAAQQQLQQQQHYHQQQQQQQPADLLEDPGMLADIPLDELLLDMPMDIPLQRQPSWEQFPINAMQLSSIQEGAPPHTSCQGKPSSIDAAARSRRAVSIGEVDLRQPLPLLEIIGTEATTPSKKSFRSISHDIGASRWAGWADVSDPIRSEAAPDLSATTTRQSVHASPHTSTSQLVCHGGGGADVTLHCDSAYEDDHSVPSISPFQRQTAGTKPAGESVRSRSVKRDSGHLPTRQDSLRSVKHASLGGLRTDSALLEGCGEFRRPVPAGSPNPRECAYQRTSLDGRRPGGQQDGAYRRSSLDSWPSGDSSQTRFTHHAEGAPAERLRHGPATHSGCSAPVRRSVTRHSLSVLPDAAVPDLGLELDRAFMEQAPEPLYFAAQLVKGMGLQRRELPEFSYRRSSGTHDGHAPTFRIADPPLRSCSFETDDSRALSSGDSQMSEDIAALDGLSDEVWDRLRRLSRSMAQVPLTGQAAIEAAMSRRIRRRSCDEGEAYCGLLLPRA